MHNGCEGRPRMLKWQAGRQSFPINLANGAHNWLVVPRFNSRLGRIKRPRRHRNSFGSLMTGLITSPHPGGLSPPPQVALEIISRPSLSLRKTFARRFNLALTIAFIILATSGAATAQPFDVIVSGHVYDRATLLPIHHAALLFQTSSSIDSMITDETGYFSIPLRTRVDDQTGTMPEKFELHNYPNPFQNRTHIDGNYDIQCINIKGETLPVKITRTENGAVINMQGFGAGWYLFILKDRHTGETRIIRGMKTGANKSPALPARDCMVGRYSTAQNPGPHDVEIGVKADHYFSKDTTLKDVKQPVDNLKLLLTHHPECYISIIDTVLSDYDSLDAIAGIKGLGEATISIYLKGDEVIPIKTKTVSLPHDELVKIMADEYASGNYQLAIDVEQELDGERYESTFVAGNIRINREKNVTLKTMYMDSSKAANIEVVVSKDGKEYYRGRSSDEGLVNLTLDSGEYEISFSSPDTKQLQQSLDIRAALMHEVYLEDIINYVGSGAFETAEGDIITFDPESYFSSPAGIDTAYVEMDQDFTKENGSYRAANDAAGSHEARITAKTKRGTVADQDVRVDVEERRLFRAYTIDNRTLMPIVGEIEIDGEKYQTDQNGFFEAQFDPTMQISTLRAGDIDTSKSFIQTYRNVPMDQDWITPAGLMITTGDSLWYNVDQDLAVDKNLFRLFAQEGVFGYVAYGGGKLRGMDFQNARNPVPNPDGKPGIVYWIDRDYAYSLFPDSRDKFSLEEQLYVKSIIEREILYHIRDPTHKPQIYLAQPGEVPILKEGKADLNFTDGIVFVTHKRGGNGYTFSSKDYNNDGIVDAPIVSIGDPTNRDTGIAEECGSIIILNNIINVPAMEGKSIQARGAYFKPADLKILGIQENMSAKENIWQVTQLPSGKDVARGHYKPLTHINDILGN